MNLDSKLKEATRWYDYHIKRAEDKLHQHDLHAALIEIQKAIAFQAEKTVLKSLKN